MSGRPRKVPSYCRHKASGQAYVTLNNREFYLGKYGSPDSKVQYAHLIAKHFPGGTVPAINGVGRQNGLTIEELILHYWTQRVAVYYRKDDEPTDRQYHIRLALRPLSRLFGTSVAAEFGPRKLRSVREEMISEGLRKGRPLNRSYVNDHIGIIKRMFRWAVSEEIVPVDVYQALRTLESLHRGRDGRVREGEKIKPVCEDHVRAVMNAACPQIRDMIGLQNLSGMRPDEVTVMRPYDIVEDVQRLGIEADDVWIYVPSRHKTEWRNIDKAVPLGPQAQVIIQPWLDREEDSYLFSPREVMAAKRRGRKQATNTQSTGRRKNGPTPKRTPGERYNDESYCQAVQRICDRIGIPRWTPNQLRHSVATRLRGKYGIEAARIILGHRSASTTEIYAERDLKTAVRIMQELG